MINYLILPKRAFTSPLLAFVNFEDGSHVNLIRLKKPYANGATYAVHETTKSPFCSNGLFRTINEAKIKFDLMVHNGAFVSPITDRGVTDNANEEEAKIIKSEQKLPNYLIKIQE